MAIKTLQGKYAEKLKQENEQLKEENKQLKEKIEKLNKQITEYQDEIFARDNNWYDMQD